MHRHIWADDEKKFMLLALKEAEKASQKGEVPVGAVIVYNNQVIAKGHNNVEAKHDATQHAEIIVIKKASARLKSWRLEECDLYVTLEPCAMCSGAITWARIKKVIYGADDPKGGAYRSALKVLGNRKLNHRPEVIKGLMADKSAELLKSFFKALREDKKFCNRRHDQKYANDYVIDE